VDVVLEAEVVLVDVARIVRVVVGVVAGVAVGHVHHLTQPGCAVPVWSP
jgi:hypothetical protein